MCVPPENGVLYPPRETENKLGGPTDEEEDVVVATAFSEPAEQYQRRLLLPPRKE